MNNLINDIILEINTFLDKKDIVSFHFINKKYYTILKKKDSEKFKIFRNIYLSCKYNLCGICMKTLTNNKIMNVCYNCSKDNSCFYHQKCFSNYFKIKKLKYSKVMSSKCIYCKKSTVSILS